MKWYAGGAIGAGGLLVVLVIAAVVFPQRDPDLSTVCAATPAAPYVDLRDVLADRSHASAHFVVVNPTAANISFSGASYGGDVRYVARDGTIEPGRSMRAEGTLAENATGVVVPPHGELAYQGFTLNGTFSPGRYVLVAHVDEMCGARRVDVA